jgi:NADH-quinone oxidoreductase subunit M
MRQKNFNWLIGYSSVAHMGFVFLGIASLNLIGITGAVLVMIAHGFLAALSFALSGYLYSITNTLEMEKLGGLLRKLPFLGAALMMALFAGCGLPGFANFAGEVTIFFGAFKTYPVVTGIAVWGASVIGAVYMLRAIRNILHGAVPDKFIGVAEKASPWLKAPYLILLASLLVFGFFPKLLTEKIEPSAKQIVAAAGGGVEPAKVAQAEPASIETKKH